MVNFAIWNSSNLIHFLPFKVFSVCVLNKTRHGRKGDVWVKRLCIFMAMMAFLKSLEVRAKYLYIYIYIKHFSQALYDAEINFIMVTLLIF